LADEPLVPYPFQAHDIARCVKDLKAEVGALITSAPGAGKTVVATEILKGVGAKVVLIIAPQGTHTSAWGRTIVRQGVADGVRILKGDQKGKAALADLRWGKAGVYVTTWQWFARQKWTGFKPDMVIADEIHYAGNYGIATQKKLHELGHVKYRLGLSGTPIRNKWENAWAICRWVEPAKVPLDFWMWRMVDCETQYSKFAPQNREVIGEKVPGKLFNSLTLYIQHRQRERCCSFHPNGFLADLPEPLRIERVIDMTAEQKRFYNSVESTLAGELLDEAGESMRVNASMILTARAMLRFCALALPVADEDGRIKLVLDNPSPKLDAFIEDLPSIEGRHILVLTHSKQFAQVAVHRLQQAGYTAEFWTGDVTKRKRDAILDSFTSGELEIIVGVISAMGTGTDGLQEVCNNLVWMSHDDDASNNIQGLGRLDRLGQSKQVVIRDYVSAASIDVGFWGKKMAKVMALEKSLRKGAT
jgi:superfamily II DNA or RNA helicase